MRSMDGTVIEVFEWASEAAIAAAHENTNVQQMWAAYADACDYLPLAELPECSDLFR